MDVINMGASKEKKFVSDNPQLMAEWDWDKNIGFSPEELSVGSQQKVWWIGICGHRWDAMIKDRTRGYGCPICSGKRVVEGVNDLESNHPDIALQWDYVKNYPLCPNMVSQKSHKQMWWNCDQGHSYKSSVDNRTRGRGCPYCGNKIVTVGKNDLASQNPLLAKEYSPVNKLGPDDVFINSHQKTWWICSHCKHEWEATVDSRNRGNGCPACASRTQSSFPEQAVFFYIKSKHPDAIHRYTNATLGKMELDIYIPSLSIGIEYDGKHWHQGVRSTEREREKYKICKALGITLIRIKERKEIEDDTADFTIISSDNLKESISKLMRWDLVVEDIDIHRDKFMIMTNYLSDLQTNSFAAKHPKIAEEWCYEKNGGLTPDMFSEFSTQAKFWWKCQKGHIWQSTIAHRTSMGANCPYCSNRKLLIGYNDFLTTNKNPQLLEEWEYELNEKEEIFPNSITEGSKTKVWWKCKRGHVWKTTISERKSGSSCPICCNHKILAGFNDLATTHPHLALEWNSERNAPLLPTMVSFGSNKKVWWKCKNGHEWQAMVLSRGRGNGCPYCAGRYAIKGENDLSITHPHLLQEWNYEKNQPLFPYECTFGSGKKVWWTCQKCANDWCASIKDRTKGHGCPVCYKNKRKQ